jgi:hypothetical protein
MQKEKVKNQIKTVNIHKKQEKIESWSLMLRQRWQKRGLSIVYMCIKLHLDCIHPHGGGRLSVGGGASVPSASTRWTIRKWHPNLQWRTAKNRPSVPYPRTVRDDGTSPALLTDFLPNALQLKTTDSTDRTKGKLELATNVTNCQL